MNGATTNLGLEIKVTNKNGPKKLLQVGVGRVIITPPLGIRMAGYTVQEVFSQSVERELTATALVLYDGVIKVAIIACDIIFIQNPDVDRIRDRIGERLGIPGENVLINTSHTHLGPALPSWQPYDNPEQKRIQERYLATLEEDLVGVAALAEGHMQPARIGAGKGSVSIGMNRREPLADGRVVIGENLDGAVDRELGVIRIDDLNGRTIATIMNAAAHTVVLGPKTAQLSPDYVGPAREIVESATGGLSLFLQGATGNVNPICGIGSGGPEQYDDLHRLGTILAGETIKTWADIRTHNRKGPRQLVQSVAVISTWDYETLPDESIEYFNVSSRRLTLPHALLPDRKSAEKQLEEYRDKLDGVKKGGGSLGEANVAERLVSWAGSVLETIDKGVNPPMRDLTFWALRINDIGIIAVSGEPFAELSLEVKERSPLPYTLFLGYSNGCIGYLPTSEAYEEGGMEVVESYRNYLLPAPLTPEWGPAIVKTSLEMLEEL